MSAIWQHDIGSFVKVDNFDSQFTEIIIIASSVALGEVVNVL